MVEFDARHKFDGIAARMEAVRVEAQGSAASLVNNTNVRMAQDLLSKHFSEEKERCAAVEALAKSDRIASGALLEEDEGEWRGWHGRVVL